MNNTSKTIITVISIFTVIAIIAGVYINVFRFMPSQGAAPSSDTVTLDGEVNSLDIDIDAANVTVKYGDKASVAYTNLAPEIKLENGRLTIAERSNRISFFPIGESSMEIILPEGTTPDMSMTIDAGKLDITGITGGSVSVDADAGNVTFTDAGAKNLIVSADAGNIQLDKCNFDIANIEVDAGNVNINNCTIDMLEADADAGNISSEGSTINSGNCNADMGNITLGGKIGDVKVNATLGNANILQD